MMTQVIVMLAGVSCGLILIWCAHWSVHRSMVRSSCEAWDYGNYRTFLAQYEKCQWEQIEPYYESHFGIDDQYNHNRIHAGIIKFHGMGMVLDPISYLFFLVWEQKHRMPTPHRMGRVRGVWSESQKLPNKLTYRDVMGDEEGKS